MVEWYTVPASEYLDKPRRFWAGRRFRLLLVGLVAALLLGSGWYARAGKIHVTLNNNGETSVVKTSGGTVADLLARKGITVGLQDEVTPSLATPLSDGLTVTVLRAVPVCVRVDGREWEVFTTAQSVGRVLTDAGVELNPHDLVLPGRRAPVTAGMEVRVVRVTVALDERETTVPFAVERRPSYNMLKGQTRLLVQGRPGLVRETWRVTRHDGQEFERRLEKSEVVAKPQNQVLLVGMLTTVTRGAQELRFREMIRAEATAYTYTGRNTATGLAPGPGTVAVDPRVIPLGSRLYIDGYGMGRAMDVGRSIKGNRVDVFFPTRQEAVQWGRRTVDVFILE
ncbi:3D domain-containing protein [Candidatus Desulforudis audaxviator]|uniref:3D domain protein n=1 Tax=Desulforudis audaxviator (strain MP104C) TaxID=477974 RepID=B1I173_DESAP|nr:3D domain-containing protein [Candidatus Desulforudis audaxviator]ACA58613.1 3D domain protein [Candidatus Desulforudis audaxviator MP104C]AZK58609.1 Cell wall-binding protein [Candidatus Desulforudis audaxviator]